jgi:CRP-like cAMP-binding protein
LLSTFHVKRFEKNEVILLEEQTADYMYLVFSGKVKAVKVSEGEGEHPRHPRRRRILRRDGPA